jgi:plastocyanin
MGPFRLTMSAALALALATAARAQPAQVVVLTWSFGFAPHPIYLAAAKPVTLTFVNRSGSSHDFTAREFFRNARIIAGGPVSGEIELRPHETRTVTLVPQRGTYHAHCSHFLHKQMGMSDEIIVQ